MRETAVVISLVLIAASVVFYIKRKKQIAKEQIPYIYSGIKIFLTKEDIVKFENSTREEKRRSIGKWRAAIKKGTIIPMWEGGVIIGYIKNTRK